ncbi:response regulator transcription factor [Aliikangiella sp. IMCC44653]
MANIWWVEDQFHWINKFQPVLESADFGDNDYPNLVKVMRFYQAAQQAIKLAEHSPDIVILDANLNGNDEAGLTLSLQLKQKWPSVAIIYLSEHSGTPIEEKAFEQNNAHDFIAKHQQNIEQVICWRIKALLRQKQLESATSDINSQILSSGALQIDLQTWNVYWHNTKLMNPNNAKRPLAPTPRKMLKELVIHSPRPVTTDQMAELLDLEKLTDSNYRQHIKILRHSFEQAAKSTNKNSFLALCKDGEGVVTFGDLHAYCWVKPQ